MNPLMARRITAGAVALSLLAGGGVLAGCGSSSSSSEGTGTRAAASASAETANGVAELPAKEILARSLAASKAATSVTVVGSQTDGQDMAFELVLGTGVGQGTLSFNGVPALEFRQVDGNLYWKISREGAEMIIGPGEASKAIGGRWVFAPVGSEDAGMADLGELGNKNALMAFLLQPKGTATVAGTGDVGGTPVVFVRIKDGNDTGTLAIQTMGEPLPVQFKGNEENGSFTFSNWNAPVNVTAPAGAVSSDDVLKQAGASG